MPASWRIALTLIVLARFLEAQSSTTISLSASPNPSVFGAAVTLTANLTPASATGRVTFYDGSNILEVSTVAAGQATLTTHLLGVGARTLRAHYSGDDGDLAANSPNVAQTVNSVAAGGFQPAVNYSAGALPNGVAAGDFNGDGKLDLAVSNYQGINILLGNGDGTFQAPVGYLPGTDTSVLAVDDFNGDGKADLVVANPLEKTVSILLGNGDGTFQAPASYTVGSSPLALTVADFNGDGIADLVVATENGTLSLLIGNGDGTLQAAVDYAFPAGGFAGMAVADFNGDGRVDMVVADADVTLPSYNGRVSVFLGNGDGSLQPPVSYSLAGAGAAAVAVGDFIGDGKMDFVVTLNPGGVLVFLGNGDGSFQPPLTYTPPLLNGYLNASGSLLVGDFNADGKLDIVASGTNAETGDAIVLLGNGDGTFQTPVSYSVAMEPTSGLVVADFNGDGRADLAAMIYDNNTVGILLGQAVVNPVVNAISVSPLHGTGASQIFSFTFSDTAGAQDLASVSVLIGMPIALGFVDCIVTYNATQNSLALWNNGTLPTTTISSGSGFQQSMWCALDGINSSVTISGNQLTLNVAIGFYQQFNGFNTTWGEAVSLTGTTSGWQQLGSWTVNVNPQPPQVVSVSPAPGIAFTQTLDVSFTDSDGTTDLSSTSVIVNATQSEVNSCYVRASPNLGVMWLANDANTAWLGPQPFSSSGSLQNSQCTVYAGEASGGVSLGNTYYLVLTIQLLTPGTNNIYADAVSIAGLDSGWQILGSWTTGALPVSVSLATSPNPATFGQPVTLTATITPGATGDVAFYDGTTILGTGTISSGIASLSAILLVTGSHKITAYYSATVAYAAARSGAVVEIISAVPDGQLVPGQTLTAGSTPVSVAVGDFNGDGIADLAVANQSDNNVSIFIGQGNGTFLPAVNYPTAPGPKAVVAADFNNDSARDLAVATESGVSILLNNGDGTFQAANTYPAGTGGASSLAIADFNGDGAADLVVGGFGTNVVLLGNGTGLFTSGYQFNAPSASSVAVGDFNSDGNADIVVTPLIGSGVFVLLGNGNATFQSPSIYATVGQISTAVAIGDFNGDGISDLAITNQTGTPSVSILLGNSDGTFQPAVSYAAGNQPDALAVGDFNGDGFADLAVTNYSYTGAGNSLNILLGKGDGTFQSPVSYPVSDSQTSVAVGDFNGDGRIDLASTNYNCKTVSIFLGQAASPCDFKANWTTTVADVQLIIDEALGMSSALNDLNGDGVVNILDIQIEINSALGLGCAAK